MAGEAVRQRRRAKEKPSLASLDKEKEKGERTTVPREPHLLGLNLPGDSLGKLQEDDASVSDLEGSDGSLVRRT
jgi:hypothetical protein